MTEDDRDPQQELNHEIRRALRHLYDPVYLQRSPLLFPLERGTLPVGQEVKTLRRILLDLVEELSPSDNVPLRSEKRRPHLALRGHYVEQRDVSAVAQELSLSERQLRRELRAGIEAMGRSFAMRYGPLNPSASTTLAQDVAEASLQAFRCQHSALDLAVEIRGVLNLLQSLCQERGISLATPRTCEPLLISSNRVILRQILLALYTTLLDCIHRAGGNALATHLEHDNASSRVTVGLAGDCPSDPSQLADQPWVDPLRNELLRFPAGVHDDCVDALAWAVRLTSGVAPPPKPSLVAQGEPFDGFKTWRDRLSLIMARGRERTFMAR